MWGFAGFLNRSSAKGRAFYCRARAGARARPRARTRPPRLLPALLLSACTTPPAPEPALDPIPAVSPPATPEPSPPLTDLDPLRPLPVLDWPVRPVHLTSDFGWRVDPVTGKGTRLHKGVDLRGAPGDLVLSVADGTVRFAGHDPLLGNMIVIDHGNGLHSWYGHMSDLLVHDGLAVERGAAIGLVGNSGRSAAPHLHLTLKLDGEAIDPRRVIGLPPWRPEAWLPDPEPESVVAR